MSRHFAPERVVLFELKVRLQKLQITPMAPIPGVNPTRFEHAQAVREAEVLMLRTLVKELERLVD